MKIDNRNQEETETSSVIRSYFYDSKTRSLMVTFRNRGVNRLYLVHDVLPKDFRNFKRSKSKGAAYNRLFRDKYEVERLVTVEETVHGTMRYLW